MVSFSVLYNNLPLVQFQGTYLHHKEIKAAMGIKITAQVLHADINLTFSLPICGH